jgi:beta-1,4-mannosyl-glycoprotein beta-1,4-N-acetylglucosaminyltransferase
MTLTDRHLEELKRERWRSFEADKRRYAELLQTDVDAVGAIAQRALRFHDTQTVCAIGEGLLNAGEFGQATLRRLGLLGALLDAEVEERRYDQALEVFQSVPPDTWRAAKAWQAGATAMAGTARLDEARQAAERALELDPDVRGARELLEALDLRRQLKTRVEKGAEVSWAELRRLVDVYLALDLGAYASRLLQLRVLDLPRPTPEDFEDGLALFKAALEVLGPAFVLERATPLVNVAGDDDRLAALGAECLIALGRPFEAAQADEGRRDLRLQRALATAAMGETEAAVWRLSRQTVKRPKELEVRAALGFYAGRRVLEKAPLVLRPPGGPRRIFNLMPFNDEIDLLKLHLAEMAEWVDLFVIAESEVTFTGQPKPLHFERRKHEFAPYADKIRHVVVGAHPKSHHSPWARDFRQRDLAVTALSGLAAPEDLVLLTDVDEIVDRRALEGFDADLAGLRMAMFRYFLNYRPDANNFPHRPTGAVLKAKLLQRFGSSYIRFELCRRKQGLKVQDAGWHFTSVCDPARLVAKINSYAHQERGAEWRDLDAVERRLREIRAGMFEPGWERAEIDESFPACILEHQDELKDLLISAPAEHGA